MNFGNFWRKFLIISIVLIGIVKATDLKELIHRRVVAVESKGFLKHEDIVRVWGKESIQSKVHLSLNLNDDGKKSYFIGWTNSENIAKIALVDGENDKNEHEVLFEWKDLDVRAMAHEPKGITGVLLWNKYRAEMIFRRISADKTVLLDIKLKNTGEFEGKPVTFSYGDSRLVYNNGKYTAYYAFRHMDGSDGETMHEINAADGTVTTPIAWGCSHSMSSALAVNPKTGKQASVCATDCFPGTASGKAETESIGGFFADLSQRLLIVAGGCDGHIGGEIGALSAIPNDNGFAMIFNAHQDDASRGRNSYSGMNQDIGVVFMDESLSRRDLVWLTETSGNEKNPVIAPFGPAEDGFMLVGWQDGDSYHLTVIDGEGVVRESIEEVGGLTKWGDRTSPFVSLPDGSVAWAYVAGADEDGVIAISRVEYEVPTYAVLLLWQMIISGVVGGIVFIILVSVAIACIIHQKHKRSQVSEYSSMFMDDFDMIKMSTIGGKRDHEFDSDSETSTFSSENSGSSYSGSDSGSDSSVSFTASESSGSYSDSDSDSDSGSYTGSGSVSGSGSGSFSGSESRSGSYSRSGSGSGSESGSVSRSGSYSGSRSRSGSGSYSGSASSVSEAPVEAENASNHSGSSRTSSFSQSVSGSGSVSGASHSESFSGSYSGSASGSVASSVASGSKSASVVSGSKASSLSSASASKSASVASGSKASSVSSASANKSGSESGSVSSYNGSGSGSRSRSSSGSWVTDSE